MEVRTAKETEVEYLANLWYDGWQDAHRQILPGALAWHRTLESFRLRLQTTLPNVRVAGPVGQPLGMCMVKDDELNQLYVSASARETGGAAALLSDAEAHLRAKGFETAWLACTIGNERAAKFYEKNGWQRVGQRVIQLDTPDGLFPLEMWQYEKNV